MPKLNTQVRKQYMEWIDKQKYTSPIIMQIHFELSSMVVQKFLREFELLGYIKRPYKGLIISQDFLDKNPKKQVQIEKITGYLLS